MSMMDDEAARQAGVRGDWHTQYSTWRNPHFNQGQDEWHANQARQASDAAARAYHMSAAQASRPLYPPPMLGPIWPGYYYYRPKTKEEIYDENSVPGRLKHLGTHRLYFKGLGPYSRGYYHEHGAYILSKE